jgi:hypothetical protein
MDVRYPFSAALALVGLAVQVTVAGSGTVSQDPVGRLQRQIETGQFTLKFDVTGGYLKSLLSALHVPVESQGLVFSKTSFQAARISPRAPRALYFNDDVYVGFVHNGEAIELASVDPAGGVAFYLLPQRQVARPKIVRQSAACMQCHQSPQTGDVPGLLMRSVFPDRDGMPVFSSGTFLTTDESPMQQRWGGWYIDPSAGEPGMGNAFVDDPQRPEQLTHVADIHSEFDAGDYLTNHSDPVALLVLAHQTHLHNLFSKAAEQTRAAISEQQAIAQAMGESDDVRSDALTVRIGAACEPVVRALLFSGEAALSAPLKSTTRFSSRFEEVGPFDPQGRSLREFDLHRRLFRYPCSYLIYSQQFDALPALAKNYIYRRMWKILTGRDDSTQFAHLSDADRDAIYHILCQTKTGLPDYWKSRK